MNLLRAAVGALVLLGLAGAALATGDDDAAGEVKALRGCGTMHRGDVRADCVRHLQRVLRLRGAPIEATGNYLADTAKYVTEFQTGRRMTADGVLGKRTLDALTDLPGNPEGWDLRSDCVSLRQPTGEADGSRGVCVTLLRTRLSKRGIRAGRGETFDATAATAVTTFQTRIGLPPIGVAGPRTRRALYRTASQSTAPACTSHGCLIVFGRADTRDLATSYPDNKFVRSLLAEAISAAACSQVRVQAAAGIACQTTTSYILDSVSQALDTAAARHACLRVRVGYPPGQKEWSPLGVEPYSGSGCRN